MTERRSPEMPQLNVQAAMEGQLVDIVNQSALSTAQMIFLFYTPERIELEASGTDGENIKYGVGQHISTIQAPMGEVDGQAIFVRLEGIMGDGMIEEAVVVARIGGRKSLVEQRMYPISRSNPLSYAEAHVTQQTYKLIEGHILSEERQRILSKPRGARNSRRSRR